MPVRVYSTYRVKLHRVKWEYNNKMWKVDNISSYLDMMHQALHNAYLVTSSSCSFYIKRM